MLASLLFSPKTKQFPEDANWFSIETILHKLCVVNFYLKGNIFFFEGKANWYFAPKKSISVWILLSLFPKWSNWNNKKQSRKVTESHQLYLLLKYILFQFSIQTNHRHHSSIVCAFISVIFFFINEWLHCSFQLLLFSTRCPPLLVLFEEGNQEENVWIKCRLVFVSEVSIET